MTRAATRAGRGGMTWASGGRIGWALRRRVVRDRQREIVYAQIFTYCADAGVQLQRDRHPHLSGRSLVGGGDLNRTPRGQGNECSVVGEWERGIHQAGDPVQNVRSCATHQSRPQTMARHACVCDNPALPPGEGSMRHNRSRRHTKVFPRHARCAQRISQVRVEVGRTTGEAEGVEGGVVGDGSGSPGPAPSVNGRIPRPRLRQG
jgi:hypothetical protein